MRKNQFRILFIAKNIPVPGKKGNPIILELAEKLRQFFEIEIDILFPKEWVPYGFNYFEKYKYLSNIEPWTDRNSMIYPATYFRLPFPNHAFRLIRLTKVSFPKQVKIKDYDLVHAHYLFPDTLLANKYLEKVKNIPVVTTIRGSDVKLLSKVSSDSHTYKLGRRNLQRSAAICAFNKPMSDFVKEITSRDSWLIPHGIETGQLISKFDHENRDIDVIVVASAIKLKRIEWVIQAFQEEAAPDQKLVIIGDGPERKKLEKIAYPNKNITFKGQIPRSEVMSYLNRSKVFALPSTRETFGMAFLEAAAKGNAIIAPANTGISGVFHAGTEALFIKEYYGFKRALRKLLRDSKLQKKLSEGAFRRAKCLTWEKVTEKYYSLYQEMIFRH